MSTIFALSTTPGKSGVAIIRISGKKAKESLSLLGIGKIEPRKALLARFIQPETKEVIDKGLALFFPTPNSFTGEDVAELHLHGSRAVIAMMQETLSRLGLKLAEPGEFSRRAFLNGKMDLTEAEGLSDLIDAETRMQHKQALRQMSGGLSSLYENWRTQLISALAHLEAYIDFPDEDLPKDVKKNLISAASQLKNSIAAHLSDNGRGEILRNGIYAAILGAPNAGKSSLLNWLAKRDVAIVSHIAGTTRDVIEVNLDISGFPVTIADTAGLRESIEVIEKEGIRRSRERAKQADLKIIMFDATSPSPDPETLGLIDENSIVLVNKIDEKPASTNIPKKTINISLKTKAGLESFLNMLALEIEKRFTPSADPQITRTRHRLQLQECSELLGKFLDGIKNGVDIELLAEELRLSALALGRITGRIDVEDILDELFRNFCIGK